MLSRLTRCISFQKRSWRAFASSHFHLDNGFVYNYKEEEPPFGFNGLGELVYRRTYARFLPDGSKEEWYQTIERVVNGTYSLRRKWMNSIGLDFDTKAMQKEAQEMYNLFFQMKILPPGRGLWAMGSPLTEERHLYAALNNCAFVSTEPQKNIPLEEPWAFLMDASMLGVGVGFDTKVCLFHSLLVS